MKERFEELTDQDMAQVRLCTMLEEVKEATSVAELDILVDLMDEDEETLFQKPIEVRREQLLVVEEARKESLKKLTKEELLEHLERIEAKMRSLEALEKRRKGEKAAPRTNDHVRYRMTEVGKTWDPGTPQMVQILLILRKDEREEWTEPELYEWLRNNQSMMGGRQSTVKVFKYYRARFLEAGALEKING